MCNSLSIGQNFKATVVNRCIPLKEKNGHNIQKNKFWTSSIILAFREKVRSSKCKFAKKLAKH